MLKPSEPGGSAFLKVDPAYLQHWQQLFPQSQLKGGLPLGHLQPPLERAPEPPQAEGFQQCPASLASSSSSTPSSSASSSSTVSSLAALTTMPAVFGALQSPEPNTLQLGPLRMELGAPKCVDRGSQGRLRCSPEELDYYLYGQQRMEIIPLSNPTTDPNNCMYRSCQCLLCTPHTAHTGAPPKSRSTHHL